MIAASSKSVNRLRVVLVLACLAVSGLAEQPMPENDYMDQFLREHNISNTKEAVTAALSNNDAVVRRGASHVLSRRWPKDAAAPIREAMLREGDELIRVGLASELAQLGDIAGGEMLLADCHHSVWGSTRVVAARKMFDLREDSCLDAVLEILCSDSDPQDTMAKIDALNFVPSFIYHFTGQQYQAVMDMTVKSMNDPDAGVRLAASVTVGRLGDTSTIAALQAAVAREQDPNIHSAMLRELNRLQGLQTKEPHRE
ncbi:MAG: HEAT repeat domain-containing protein [Terriglobales bacterium]